jgi:hypothetical protein
MLFMFRDSFQRGLVVPFKSKAQRRKFAELLVKGEITPEVFEEWNRETGGKKLPEQSAPLFESRACRHSIAWPSFILAVYRAKLQRLSHTVQARCAADPCTG